MKHVNGRKKFRKEQTNVVKNGDTRRISFQEVCQVASSLSKQRSRQKRFQIFKKHNREGLQWQKNKKN